LHYTLKRENGTPHQNYAQEMEHLSSAMEQHQEQQQTQWRRDKVQELCSKGYSQREISQILQIALATVNRDVSYLRNEAKHIIKRYIDERLPDEYEKCLVGLTAILREAWNTTLSEDKDLLEEQQEEKAGEITTTITNQVF
jgi:Trp operon repressor